MGMLGGGDDPDGCSLEEGQGRTDDNRVEIHPEWYMQYFWVSKQGRMAKVDQHIGIVEQLERQVTGTITGIAADDDREPLAGEGICDPGCLPLEPCRELEGDRSRSPLPEP